MISLGQDEIAKYPFLAEAGQYLKDKGFTLEQFATDPDLRIIEEKHMNGLNLQQRTKLTILN